MTKRKPLKWYTSDFGATPDCADCLAKLTEPGFVAAAYSVGIEHPGDPAELAIREISRYHADGHRGL